MIDLKDTSTLPPKGTDEKQILEETKHLEAKLSEMQNKLYASKTHSILIVLQGTDTAGKDGTISKVFSVVNPQGCNVSSFKSPTEEEAAHDFLWRIYPHTPAKGMIQIFNRSHYEDILFPLVHKTIDKSIVKKRYDVINHFEEELAASGTLILKFFLHISQEEQKRRLAERLTMPHKRWKYSAADAKEEPYFDDYMRVYEKIVNRCGPDIPWTIVPADAKWYRNYVVAKTLVHAIKALDLKYPM